MDFNIKIYLKLLGKLKSKGYSFQTFAEFLLNPEEKVVILRHDVDLNPNNSLSFAKIQSEMGIKGSYYFRAVPESWDEDIIRNICSMGHEIGYHYENMDVVSQLNSSHSGHLTSSVHDSYRDHREGESRKDNSQSGLPFGQGQSRQDSSHSGHHTSSLHDSYQDFREGQSHWSTEYDHLLDLAYEDFCKNLEKLRQLVPVSTICMHGSPRSKFDNKAIWDKYDYKALGIIGEPYYDMNFDEVFYLTDTGRRWDGWKVSVRDKVPQQELWDNQGLTFHSTQDIIDMIDDGRAPSGVEAPSKIMFTFHPQRWHASLLPWTKELLLQNAKNIVKRLFFVKRH